MVELLMGFTNRGVVRSHPRSRDWRASMIRCLAGRQLLLCAAVCAVCCTVLYGGPKRHVTRSAGLCSEGLSHPTEGTLHTVLYSGTVL